MKLKQILKESSQGDRLSKLIDQSIVKVDEELNVKYFAEAVAKVLKEQYGEHNYKDFMTHLKRFL